MKTSAMGYNWMEEAIASLDAKNRDKLAMFMGLTPIPAEEKQGEEKLEDVGSKNKGTPAE